MLVGKKAFTLIELLIVIAIIGILASVIVISLSNSSESASSSSAKFNVAQSARYALLQMAEGKTTPATVCPAGAERTQGTDKKLYCIYANTGGGTFVIYEIFKDITASSTDSAWCMDDEDGKPILTDYDTSTSAVAATEDCTETDIQ